MLHLDSPVITIPNTAPAPRITFDHWVATEPGWDGGNVKISVNGGAWQIDPGVGFIYNAYNGTLFTGAHGNTNPIAGQPAFTGTDGGSVTALGAGRSSTSRGIAKSRQTRSTCGSISGTDGCSGTYGWYVDDVEVEQCR